MPKRILVVEDNELNLDMLRRRLDRLGYTILVAMDGAQGIEVATREQPDVILMDMSLPVMDGWEATRNLKADPATARIPVIGLSAHAMSEDKQRALAVGCDDYETKPINLNRLVEKIEHLCATEDME